MSGSLVVIELGLIVCALVWVIAPELRRIALALEAIQKCSL